MKSRLLLAAGIAALAFGACGKSGSAAPQSATSAAAASADAASPLEKPFVLKDAAAVDADAIFALLPESARPTYESSAFDAALGATVVTGLSFASSAAESTQRILIDRAEFYGVDLAAIERAKAAEPAIDAPFEKIFEKVRLFGLRSAEEGENEPRITVGAAEIDRFRVRQGGFAETESEETSGIAQAFNAFELAGLYFKDMAISMSGEEAGGEISVAMPDLRFVGVGGGKLSALIANDLEYEIVQTEASRLAAAEAFGPQGALLFSGPIGAFLAPAEQRVTVGAFDWRNIDFSGWLGYAVKHEEPPISQKNLINLGALKMSDATTYIGGRKASTIAEVAFPVMEFTWLFPSKIRSVTKGAVNDFTAYLPPEEEDAIAILKSHGLDKVAGAADMSWDWDAAKGGAAFKTSYQTQGLADMALSADFDGLVLESIHEAMQAGATDALGDQGRLKGFSLSVADESLLDAMFDIAGLQSGVSAAELRTSAPSMIRLSGAQAASLSPRIAGYIDAIANFVAEGGAIEIAAKPAEPLSFKGLVESGAAGPETIPDTLNLTVTHKKK